ncbi:SseB family protein [uncultured Williamsia sp.]|uniref:SseB family protein n=1 Tax=uncultured Williamsia sp. TaxID=259311 RepID=UPI00260E9D22|nr:SseB family protein [uncultured Williamsia sp.]
MDFTQERAAFLAGYGDPVSLLTALREQALYVPLDVDDQFFTLVVDDMPWNVAFTTWERAQDFARAAGRDLASVNVYEVTGGPFIDTVTTEGPVPTGLVVDAHQADTMVFPPDALTPGPSN